METMEKEWKNIFISRIGISMLLSYLIQFMITKKSLKDITPEATDGIILALGVPGLVDEVKGQIEGIFKKEQIMYPKL